MKLRHMKVTRFEAARFVTGYLSESGIEVFIDKPPVGETGGPATSTRTKKLWSGRGG